MDDASFTALDPAEAYGLIEQAYCEDRWADVLSMGNTLLIKLSGLRESPLVDLRQRLQILLAHTNLYGLEKPDAARDLYNMVLKDGGESSLMETARQGLHQCIPSATAPEKERLEKRPLQEAAPASAAMPWIAAEAETTKEFTETVEPLKPDSSTIAQPSIQAAPWAATTSSEASPAPLVPDVVDEPELIAVHQSDPLLSEEIELEIQPGTTRGYGEDHDVQSGENEDADLMQGLLKVVIA